VPISSGFHKGASLLLPRDRTPAHITSLSLGPTGRLYTGYSSGMVKSWQVEGPNLLQLGILPPQSQSAITVLTQTATGSSVAVSNHAALVRVWTDGRIVLVPPLPEVTSVRSLGICGGAKKCLMYASSTRVYLWNLRENDFRASPLGDASCELNTARMSPDGSLVAATTSEKVLLWDTQFERRSQVLPRLCLSTITSLAFSASGNLLAGGSRHGTVEVWSTEGQRRMVGEVLVGPNQVSTLAFSQCSSELFAGCEGTLTSINISNLGTPVWSRHLVDWGSSTVRDMVHQQDQVLIVTASPGLRMRTVPVDMERKGEQGKEPAGGHQGKEPGGGDKGKEPEGGHRGEKPENGDEGKEPEGGDKGKEPEGGHQWKEPEGGDEGKEPEDGYQWKEPEGGDKGKEPAGGHRGEKPESEDEGKEPAGGHQVNKPGGGREAWQGEPGGAGVEIKKGMLFATKNEAMSFVKCFSESRKTQFVIETNSTKVGKALLYKCRHGKKRSTESTGERPLQRTVKKDCLAFIKFYVRVSGETVLTDFNVDHENHAINQNIFTQDTAKADPRTVEIIRQMLDGNCRVANIKKALASKNIYMSSDQIRYQIKLIVGAPMHEEKLAELIQVVKEEGGNVNILRFPDGKVRVLTITTAKMKRAYSGAKPTVVQIDTTFGIESSGYKLNAVLYRNPATGKGEVVQLAFMADETNDSYSFAITGFWGISKSSPTVILIDKVNIAPYPTLPSPSPLDSSLHCPAPCSALPHVAQLPCPAE
jgi:hypothetical protein